MVNILGVANGDYRSHDNAACVLKDGVLVAAAEEERFLREKHAYDTLPIEAIRFCLREAGLSARDIDLVAVGWDIHNLQIEHPVRTIPVASPEELTRRFLPEDIFGPCTAIPFVFVPHHLAHASSAYYTSGFDDSAVIVLDGSGESEATTHWRASSGTLEKSHSLDQDPHSLGFMFEGVCDYLGLPGDSAGIVMGLASYGPSNIEPFDVLELTEDGYRINIPDSVRREVDATFATQDHYYIGDKLRAYWVKICEEIFGPRESVPRGGNPTTDSRRLVAAKVQKTIETALIHSARMQRQNTGMNNLCLSGGAALNCSANGVLERTGIFDNVHIYPASNDAGVAVGAALHAYHSREFSSIRGHVHTTPYLGPQFSDAEILSALQEAGLTHTQIQDDTFGKIAELITNGAIIGWFQGRMEIGPRALGARSIIASPTSTEIRDRVNDIKRRERWRPLAPSILEGYEADFFEPSCSSPFMLKAAVAKPEVRSVIPGVVHVDGTSRYQSVIRATNPAYWELIDSFRRITGVPLVLNTSFNDRGEPVVCSPYDAIQTFRARPLDHLVIGKYLVNQKQ